MDFGQVQGASYAVGEVAVARKMLQGALSLAPEAVLSNISVFIFLENPESLRQFSATLFVQHICIGFEIRVLVPIRKSYTVSSTILLPCNIALLHSSKPIGTSRWTLGPHSG